MQKYDVTLKLLLQCPAKLTLLELAGCEVKTWLNVELPKMQIPRADLLGETADGGLVHIELQSGNDASMPLRMAEYCLGIFRTFGKLPRQVLLYVGEASLSMASELRGDDVWFRYRIVDMRELDGDRLLESSENGDNVIAILARLRDDKAAVRRIVEKIAGLPEAQRATALQQLVMLAGLRKLEDTVNREVARMPIYIDIMENKVLGPAFKKGLEEGREEGELRATLKLLRRLMEKRFGALPVWAEDRLASRSASELEALSARLLDAPSLEELLQ